MMLPEMDAPVIVQGITGKFGSFHTSLMLQYGTNIVAGVTPGKAGERVWGVEVFNTVADAVVKTGARVSVVFVPAPNFYPAVEEAMRAGVRLIVGITERVPISDEVKLVELAKIHGTTLIGPNTPGLIIPPKLIKLGIMPAGSFRAGNVALLSRSGTLMYEIANRLSIGGFGQALAVGIGGDPINGTTLRDFFDLARDREDVHAVVAVGEIGGDAEERLAEYITETRFPKPVFAYIAGRSAPKEKRMGHAGAIIYGNYGTAESKISALREAGVKVAMTPAEIPALLTAWLGKP